MYMLFPPHRFARIQKSKNCENIKKKWGRWDNRHFFTCFNTHQTTAPSQSWHWNRNAFSVIFPFQSRFQAIVRRIEANLGSVFEIENLKSLQYMAWWSLYIHVRLCNSEVLAFRLPWQTSPKLLRGESFLRHELYPKIKFVLFERTLI